MKFPRCIRLDNSDINIFHRAAAPGEWLVTGTFAYVDRNLADLDNKTTLAFHTGWLGCEAFGHATLAEVADISEAEFFQVVERLARHFVECYGAPDLVNALPVARAEADDAAGLCAHKIGTLLALERCAGDDGITERVRLVVPARAKDHARIWDTAADNSKD